MRDQLAGMKILITGASGFIGTVLCRTLAARGATISALDLKPPREFVPGVVYHSHDVRSLDILADHTFDAIYHLAAVHVTPGHRDLEYFDTNVRGASSVISYAERNRVPQIIFTSSISVYGPSESRLSEESIPKPQSAYGHSKLISEELFQSWCSRDPARRLTIVRPAVVFGKGEKGNFDRMAAMIRSGLFLFAGRRDTIKSCIYVEHLVDIIITAAQTGRSTALLNAAYSEELSIGAIVAELKSSINQKAILLTVPSGFLKLIAGILKLSGGLGLGVHPDRVDKLRRSTNIAPGWLDCQGVSHRYRFRDGVKSWLAE